MSRKLRTPIPDDISVEVMYSHNRTCCVCNIRGLAVQIHHIDENPSNHTIDNLTVLCLQDHEQTQIRGGFGKKLRAGDVKKCRDMWIARIHKIRERADEIFAQAMAGADLGSQPTAQEWSEPSEAKIIGYLNALPHLRRAALVAAQPRWNTGIGSEMLDGCYEVIEILERACHQLAKFYPQNHFNDTNAPHFFDAFLASRYRWYRALYEPRGSGTGGTIVSQIVAGNVMQDAASSIAEIVEGLIYSRSLYAADFNMKTWRLTWDDADSTDNVVT
jgi:hypothetical protein